MRELNEKRRRGVVLIATTNRDVRAALLIDQALSDFRTRCAHVVTSHASPRSQQRDSTCEAVLYLFRNGYLDIDIIYLSDRPPELSPEEAATNVIKQTMY